jgi:very-short-patch-repair endonuclease
MSDVGELRFRLITSRTLRRGMQDTTPLRPALALAQSQDGAITIGQLRSLGVTEGRQRGAVTAGWLHAAAPGVLVLGGSPDTWRQRLVVAYLSLGGDIWVSHESAACLHGLDRSRELIELSVPRSRRGARSRPGVTLHTVADLAATDVIWVSGLRCTSATRTIVDLAAAGADDGRLAAAIDSAVHHRLSAPIVIAKRLTELGPRRGCRLLGTLLVDAGGESTLERLFLALVRRAALPRPTTQHVVRAEGRHIARVDFLYEAHRLVVEVTGRRGHSTPDDRQRDAQRRNELQTLGYTVVEYTWADVTNRSAYVTASLRTLLGRPPSPMSDISVRRDGNV